jgi:hypothetical protein
MTRLYLTNKTPNFIPTNFRGSWDSTASAVTKVIDRDKQVNDNITSVSATETSATNPFSVCLYRGVSGPLAVNLGDYDPIELVNIIINVMIGVWESSSSADFNWKIHIYFTAGDTDTVRATLINNYTEGAGVNEWGTDSSLNGKTLNANTSGNITASTVQNGDRLVVEIGFIARNSTTTSFTGNLRYGSSVNGYPGDDLTSNANSTLGIGYIDTSTIGEFTQQSIITNSQEISEVSYDNDPAVIESQQISEVPYQVSPVVIYNSHNISEPIYQIDPIIDMSHFFAEVMYVVGTDSNITLVRRNINHRTGGRSPR